MLSLEPVQPHHERAFLAAARRSTALHHPWISPPRTRSAFRQHLARYGVDNQASYVVMAEDGELVGSIHLNEIVHGALESSYMAYYVFAPYQRRGFMSAALALFIDRAFDGHGLHRLEANIQPDNLASRALVQRLGFRLEGFSPRYLRINGAWRDHERYALTVEDWRGEQS